MSALIEPAAVRSLRPVLRGYVPGRFGQVHFRRSQPAATTGKRPLVLLHQNPSSSLEYERLIEAMATDRTVVALDTPGYGMSDSPPAPLPIADYAACLIEAAEELDVLRAQGCDVYGFHTGALLAAEFALAAPARVHRIVVSGIPMRSVSERRELLNSACNPAPLDEEGETALQLAERLWDFIVRQRAAGVSLERAAAMWVEKLRPLDRIAWAYRGVWSYDFAARLPLIRQPLLLLQSHEEISAHSMAAAVLVPGSTVVEMPEFSRDLFELPDAIARMADEMRQFLDGAA